MRLIDTISHGYKVTILVPNGKGRDGQEWAKATGRAVMRSAIGGWVLVMDHGRVGLASDSNILEVQKTRRRMTK